MNYKSKRKKRRDRRSFMTEIYEAEDWGDSHGTDFAALCKH